MKCPACGAENPNDRIYCHSCSERMEESTTSGLGREVTSTPDNPLSESPQPIPSPMRFAASGRSLYLAATYAAVIALILLAIGLVLYMYYYENVINPDHGIEDFESWFNIAKASMYSEMFGEIVVVLALILVVQGKMGEQKELGGPVISRPLALVNVRLLLLVALVVICVATVVMIYLYEFEPDLSDEAMRMTARLYLYLPRAAWVFATFGLLLVANGLRRKNG